MDGAQVGVLLKSDDVGVDRFPERMDFLWLETKLMIFTFSDALDETHERSTVQQQVIAFLVALDLAERNCVSLKLTLA